MAFMSQDDCKEYFESIQRMIAQPNTTLTQHDRQRAIALIMYMRPKDISLNRYMNIVMTDEDHKAVNEIAKHALK
jgi:hypothetical protein